MEQSHSIVLTSNTCSFDGKNYTFNLSSPFMCEKEEYLTVKVVSLAIPKSFYMINEYNDSVTITYISNLDGSSPLSDIELTLKHGNYEVSDLATYIQDEINDIHTTFQVSIEVDEINYKISIEISTTDKKGTFNIGCYKILGFTSENYNITSENIQISENCGNASPTQSIYIKSPIISSSFTSVKSSTLHREPVDVEQFYYIHMSYPSDEKRIYKDILDKIELSIVDEDEHVLDFNGLQWSLTLLIKKTKQYTEYEQITMKTKNDEKYIDLFTEKMMKNLTTIGFTPLYNMLNTMNKNIKNLSDILTDLLTIQSKK